MREDVIAYGTIDLATSYLVDSSKHPILDKDAYLRALKNCFALNNKEGEIHPCSICFKRHIKSNDDDTPYMRCNYFTLIGLLRLDAKLSKLVNTRYYPILKRKNVALDQNGHILTFPVRTRRWYLFYNLTTRDVKTNYNPNPILDVHTKLQKIGPERFPISRLIAITNIKTISS